jgi:hypothetical protein
MSFASTRITGQYYIPSFFNELETLESIDFCLGIFWQFLTLEIMQVLLVGEVCLSDTCTFTILYPAFKFIFQQSQKVFFITGFILHGLPGMDRVIVPDGREPQFFGISSDFFFCIGWYHRMSLLQFKII